MKGLALSRAFYEECGKEKLEKDFADILPLVAIGLCGSGSECYGYDDGVSTDHDFEPGFCLFLPGEDVIDRRTAFLLERAYASLPKEFKGYRRPSVSPVGGNRHGVIRMADFFTEKVGKADGVLTLSDWLTLPDYALAEATNGEIFRDDSGVFTSLREGLSHRPEDIRLKKLAGHLLNAAQAGQYNYTRILSHGETGAAQLAVFTFVQSAMNAVFLLNRAYMPYYKWSFRALRALPRLSGLADTFEFLLTTENDAKTADAKAMIIEDVSSMLIGELQAQNLTEAICGDLEKHAYSVNDRIENPDLRNAHILAAI